mmetsp:Transcript_16075/g.36920  ORF Transcript_16075/g.36920 Transcript_16075/m.36920 type:complete len:1239 (-) Transcript_16075:89-3805(-)
MVRQRRSSQKQNVAAVNNKGTAITSSSSSSSRGPKENSSSISSSLTSSSWNPKFAAVPPELIIRSLRRRFWQALQNDNADRALRLYTATLDDWQVLLLEEEQDVENKKDAKLIVPAFKRNRFGRRSNDITATTTVTACNALGWPSVLEANRAILPLALKPTDFFWQDDMLHPVQDSYREWNHLGKSNNGAPPGTEPKSSGSHQKSWFGGRSSSTSKLTTAEEESALLQRPPQDIHRQTTPLHEAARLGNSDLLRFLLGSDRGELDVNLKNGAGRTPLHNVAGGLTIAESTRVQHQDDIAILAPQEPQLPGDEKAQKSRRRSFVQLQPKQQQKQLSQREGKLSPLPQKKSQRLSSREWKVMSSDRMDSAKALMSLDSSTNAVDSMNRTPMHYAAALGRKEMSVALFNTFGTLLTVVDNFSRTPAEWAALHSHKSLAAELEARALLYLDPLEMDLLEERMEQQQSTGGALSPPFAWFTTFGMDRVQKEREFRVKVVLDRLHRILARLSVGQSACDLLLSHTNSLGDSEPDAPPPTAALEYSKQNQEQEEGHSDLSALSTLSQAHVTEFLSYHNWDVKKTLAVFYEDPVGSLERAKVSLPKQGKESRTKQGPPSKMVATKMCLICCEEFDTSNTAEWRHLDTCEHGFCIDCLGDYITDCAEGRQYGLCVPCPHHQCSVAMSNSLVLEVSPSEKVRRQLISAANSNFVVQAKDFRFCPLPGCENVVKFIPPKNKSGPIVEILSASGAVCCSSESHVKRKEGSPFINYEGMYDECYYDCRAGIQPKRAHRFCFHCGEGAHWPVSCQLLQSWLTTVDKHVKEVERDGDGDVNEVSHKLWLKANTKPCPKCKAPIEKNDGCNHVTCVNPHCNHEFCWICQQDWNLHSTSTGGFFRCNRWVDQGEEHQYYDKAPAPEELVTPTDEDLSDPRRMRSIYGTAMHETRAKRRRARETARFIHHYQRYSAHSDSMELEGKMFDSCSERLKPTVLAAIEFSGDDNFNFGGKGLSFVFDAFTELRECRSVLKYSYALSYFRYTGARKRSQRRKLAESLAFEQMQSELEMLTEQMSDLVGRQQIRATQSQILYMTLTAAQKRRDFSSFMMRVLAKDVSQSNESSNNGEVEEEEGNDENNANREDRWQMLRGMGLPRTAADTTLITGLAGNPRGMIDNQGLQGARLVMMDTVQASLQTLRDSTLDNLLRLNTSYDDDEEDVYDDGAPRQWSCSACTYINTSGRYCAMCAQPSNF